MRGTADFHGDVADRRHVRLCGGARSAPPFLPGKGSCFWESGRKSIGSEKVSGSIGLLMEVLYVGISCSVDIWCTDEHSRRF